MACRQRQAIVFRRPSDLMLVDRRILHQPERVPVRITPRQGPESAGRVAAGTVLISSTCLRHAPAKSDRSRPGTIRRKKLVSARCCAPSATTSTARIFSGAASVRTSTFGRSRRIHFARFAILNDPDRGPGRTRLLFASHLRRQPRCASRRARLDHVGHGRDLGRLRGLHRASPGSPRSSRTHAHGTGRLLHRVSRRDRRVHQARDRGAAATPGASGCGASTAERRCRHDSTDAGDRWHAPSWRDR